MRMVPLGWAIRAEAVVSIEGDDELRVLGLCYAHHQHARQLTASLREEREALQQETQRLRERLRPEP
jgi:hypothetical protein